MPESLKKFIIFFNKRTQAGTEPEVLMGRGRWKKKIIGRGQWAKFLVF
jgi:hypothetical protein